MQDLNDLIDPSLGWELRNANAINDKGQIVGFGEHRGFGLHAFRYSGGKVEDLGTFPGGGISYAIGINSRGDVVGAAYLDASGAGNFQAMLYTDAHGIQNLNDLIDPSLGWKLAQATAINDRGQIAGWGFLKGNPNPRAFRLTRLAPRFRCMPLETVLVPVDGSSVLSHTILELGVTYRLRASGTFVIGGPGFADAEYAFNDSVATIINNCFGDPSGVDLGIGIDDAANSSKKSPFWGAFDHTHTYTTDFVGHGGPINLNYHDCYYADNSGSLTVEIFPVDNFDICMVNNATGNVLRFDSLTGDYQLIVAGEGAQTINGKGNVSLDACRLRLTDTDSGTNAYAINMVANVDICSKKGTAKVVLVPGVTLSIDDSNTADNLCICP